MSRRNGIIWSYSYIIMSPASTTICCSTQPVGIPGAGRAIYITVGGVEFTITPLVETKNE